MKILKASSYYLELVKGYDLEERAKKGKLSFILLNQPPVCDYHCKRCFMPNYRRKSYNKEDALSLKECESILNDASSNGIKCLEISGEGEPLMSKNLKSIIELANKNGLMTTLITNGNTLDMENAIFYKNHNVTLIFSLHTLNQAKYEEDNNCKDSFERKLRNIELATKIYKDTKRIEQGFEVYNIGIHATLQKDNINEIDELIKFCRANEMFFSIAPLAVVGSALNHPEIHLKKKLEEVVYKGDNSIIHSLSSKKVFGREVCGTAFYGINIGWDGAILLDAHYGYEIGEKNILGNIKRISFKEAIQKQRIYMKKLFENINGSCPVRDKKGKIFLEKVLSGKITLTTE